MINLRVLVPDATVNYVKNPSLEVDTTGWNSSGSLGAELVQNGSFEIGNPPANWTPQNATSAQVAGSVSPNAVQITNTAATTGMIYQQLICPAGTYQLTLWHKNGNITGFVNLGIAIGGFDYVNQALASAVWTLYTITFTTAVANPYLQLWVGAGVLGQNVFYDIVSVVQLFSSSATLSRTLDRARFGIASGKVVTNGTALNEGAYYKISWMNTISDQVTASVYVRGAGTVRLRLADAALGKNWISKSLALNDERWQRLEISGQTGGTTDLRLWIETADALPKAVTFYVDGAQLERKPSATSYCDGDQPGCRWDIIANSTMSVRTADTREGGRWVPLAGPCRAHNDLYVTVLGGFGMPNVTNNMQEWSNSPGSFFQSQKIENRVVTLSFTVKKEALRTGTSAPSLSALHELRQQLIDLIKPDLTLNYEAFLFEYSDTDSDKPLYLRMRYEAGLEGEWDIRNRWYNSFPVRMIAVDPLWSEDSQDVMQMGIRNNATVSSNAWMRRKGEWIQPKTGAGLTITGNNVVYAIVAASDGTIYIGGGRPFVSGFLYKWDGTVLTLLGTATGSAVYSLGIGLDGSVYIGGDFTDIGGVAALRIAKYNPVTGSFTAMGSGFDFPVYAICAAPNGQIYVGGQFTATGALNVFRIARWDGLQWRTVGATSGVSDTVRDIINAGDGLTLYMGGEFTASNGGGVTYNGTASINITTNLLSAMGSGVPNTNSLTLGADGAVYAGAVGVSKYSGGQSWNSIATLDNIAWVIARGQRGEIYAGGYFKTVNGRSLIGVAKWFGGNWNPIEFPSFSTGTSLPYAILEMANGDLYVGGALQGLLSYPKTTLLNNRGTTSCWPLLQINGPGTLRYISNIKTGQEIFMNLVIFSGEQVTIDFAKGKVTSNSRSDLSYTLLPGSEVRSIFLLPGDNLISMLIMNDVLATAQLRWQLQDWSADAVIDAEKL